METKEETLRKRVAPRRLRQYDVKTKCEAVLSVWSERRRPAEVCRELGIPWGMLSAWQNRAMEGMLQGLSPKQSLENRPAALSPLLEQRLGRKLAKVGRLQRRLKAVEAASPSPEKPKE